MKGSFHPCSQLKTDPGYYSRLLCFGWTNVSLTSELATKMVEPSGIEYPIKIFISKQVSCINYRASPCLGAIDISIAQVTSLGSLSYNGANGTTITPKGLCSALNHFISTSPSMSSISWWPGTLIFLVPWCQTVCIFNFLPYTAQSFLSREAEETELKLA